MNHINGVLEKNAKTVYNILKSNDIENFPINGAIINIVSSEMFTPISIAIHNIDDCYLLQTCTLFNTKINIDTPIYINRKEGKVYYCIDENSYFLNSFYNNNCLFPEKAVFKEDKIFSNFFKYYYLEKSNNVSGPFKYKNFKCFVGEKSNKLNAISEFYNVLLKDFSTREGIYILINIMMLLFNYKANNTAIREKSLIKMKEYISNELQNLDGNKDYKMQLVSYDVKESKIYSLLEWRILNGFCSAFNSVSKNSKQCLRDIFNEKSKK